MTIKYKTRCKDCGLEHGWSSFDAADRESKLHRYHTDHNVEVIKEIVV